MLGTMREIFIKLQEDLQLRQKPLGEVMLEQTAISQVLMRGKAPQEMMIVFW